MTKCEIKICCENFTTMQCEYGRNLVLYAYISIPENRDIPCQKNELKNVTKCICGHTYSAHCLIRFHELISGWSACLLGMHSWRYIFSCCGLITVNVRKFQTIYSILFGRNFAFTVVWLNGMANSIDPDQTAPYWPRWLSWMRSPTGDQEVTSSTPAEVGNILSWRLIMKYFLWSFSPFRWFKKGSCQFLAKECAQYWLTA